MIFNTDWDGLDWERHGLPKREGPPITRAQKETWAGTSEPTFRGFPGNYGRGLAHNITELAVPDAGEKEAGGSGGLPEPPDPLLTYTFIECIWCFLSAFFTRLSPLL